MPDYKLIFITVLSTFLTASCMVSKKSSREPGSLSLYSEAKFVHLWQKKNGEWKITRIISYAHIENLK